MDKKKLVKKMALGALIVLGVLLLIELIQFPYQNKRWSNYQTRLQDRIDELTGRYQGYLDETASEITAVPADGNIISRIQSEFLRDEDNVKKYLWMMNRDGVFMFGVPSDVFTRMNGYYTQYESVIRKDNAYVDRGDFLAKLVDKHDEIDFKEMEMTEPEKDEEGNPVPFRWRQYDPSRRLRREWSGASYGNDYFLRPRVMLFSAPVENPEGQLIGNLYLKIDDSAHEDWYYSRPVFQGHDVFSGGLREAVEDVLIPLALMFLWFLLPTWVYLDTVQRGIRSPILWVLLALIAGPLGWIVYMITRPSVPDALSCPACGKELNGTRAFCPYCGFDLSETFCPKCQYPVKTDYRFCPSCRAELKPKSKSNSESKPDSERPQGRKGKKSGEKEILLADEP